MHIKYFAFNVVFNNVAYYSVFAIIIFNIFGDYEMREIKFRIRNTVNGSVDFVTLEYLMTNDQTNISPKGFREDLQVSQFTGLKDKNGAEIYEGDIVNHNGIGIGYIDYNDKHAAYKIVFKGTTRKWLVDMLGREIREIEIIGNIYENPELIKPL